MATTKARIRKTHSNNEGKPACGAPAATASYAIQAHQATCRNCQRTVTFRQPRLFPIPSVMQASAQQRGGAAAAEPWFNRGLEVDPKKQSAHRYLAKLYEELFGDSVRAERHYEAYKADAQ